MSHYLQVMASISPDDPRIVSLDLKEIALWLWHVYGTGLAVDYGTVAILRQLQISLLFRLHVILFSFICSNKFELECNSLFVPRAGISCSHWLRFAHVRGHYRVEHFSFDHKISRVAIFHKLRRFVLGHQLWCLVIYHC